jgi:hypothetical protein
MMGMDIKIEDRTHRVKDAADRAGFRNVGHAVASIRKDAIESIVPGDGPSEPGTPPHTQTGGVTRKGKLRRGNLPRSIRFAVDSMKQEAVVGPMHSIMGEAGAAHEHGEEFLGDDYPERPFMRPAGDKNFDRFGDSFANSFTE